MFVIKYSKYQLPESSNLIGWKLEVGVVSSLICSAGQGLRQILALNCLLDIAQGSSDTDFSDGGVLALAFHCLCFLSASQLLFASKSSSPFLMRKRPFAQSCTVSFRIWGMLRSLLFACWIILHAFLSSGDFFFLKINSFKKIFQE